MGHYVTDIVLGQRIAPGEPLSSAWKARVGHAWLFANEAAGSRAWSIGPSVALTAIPDLPGYVDVGYYEAAAPVDVGGSDTLGSMFLAIPTAVGRDLEDLTVETRDGEEWLRWGGTVLRPQATVQILPAGAGAVRIGAEGYAEWRRATSAATVTTSGASDWKVLDADLTLVEAGHGDAAGSVVPAGGYLVVFADPRVAIGVAVR
jgi:hypothetical protein